MICCVYSGRIQSPIIKWAGFNRLLTSSAIDLTSPDCNVTKAIADRIGSNLHQKDGHPLNTIHRKICEYWGDSFTVHDNLSPIVSTHDAFDVLRIPADHVSRSVSDTYYVDQTTVLRPHTSAHQVELLRQPRDATVSCDGRCVSP